MAIPSTSRVVPAGGPGAASSLDMRSYKNDFDTAPREAYRDDTISLVTNIPEANLTAAQKQQLAKTVKDAWNYDEKTLGWLPKTQQGRLIVLLYSDAEMAKRNGKGTYGVALDGSTFAVPVGLVAPGQKPSDYAGNLDTVGHEVSHVQSQRAASTNVAASIASHWDGIKAVRTQSRNNFYRIPVYLEEGKAWAVGDRFAGLKKNPDSLAHVRQMIGKHTGAETTKVMQHFRDSSSEDGHWIDVGGEEFGALYVEFLRTHLQVGRRTGVPDTIRRIAQLTEAIGGGQTFTQAFTALFGISPNDAVDQFDAHMKATEHDDQARYEGTIYDVRGPQYAIPDADPAAWRRALDGP